MADHGECTISAPASGSCRESEDAESAVCDSWDSLFLCILMYMLGGKYKNQAWLGCVYAAAGLDRGTSGAQAL